MPQLFSNVPHSNYMYHDVPPDVLFVQNFQVDQSVKSFEMHFKTCYFILIACTMMYHCTSHGLQNFEVYTLIELTILEKEHIGWYIMVHAVRMRYIQKQL